MIGSSPHAVHDDVGFETSLLDKSERIEFVLLLLLVEGDNEEEEEA
jgi:hypothetical protein